MNHGVKRAIEILPQHLQALKGLIPDTKETLNNGELSLTAMQECSESLEKQGVEAASDIKAYFDKLRSILTKREEALKHGVTEQVEKGQTKLEQNTLTLSKLVQKVRECTQELEQAISTGSVDILLKEQQLQSRLWSGQQDLKALCGTATTLKTLSVEPPPLEDKRLEVLCSTLATTAPSPLPRRRQELLVPSVRISRAYDQPSGTENWEGIKNKHKSFSEYTFESVYEVVCPPSPRPPLRKESHFSDSTIVKPELVWGASMLRDASATMPVYPRGVCCGAAGIIVITDIQNHCLRMLTNTGRCINMLGREGHGEGQFCEPTSVTADLEGNLLVCDLRPARVQKFSSNGMFHYFYLRKFC